MTRQSRFIFSALLSLLVLLVFAFAFSLSILLADTDSLSDINFVINKEQQRNTISTLNVKIYSSEEELTRSIDRYLRNNDNRLRAGFATWRADSTECTIFVTEPKRESDFDSWGHELGHCVYGHWHPFSH